MTEFIGRPVCEACGKRTARCVGQFDGSCTPTYACSTCCDHEEDEDGACERLELWGVWITSSPADAIFDKVGWYRTTGGRGHPGRKRVLYSTLEEANAEIARVGQGFGGIFYEARKTR